MSTLVCSQAVVELSSKAKQHFVKSHKVFEAEVDIRVNPALAISRPEVPNGVLRVAPNTKIQLESAWYVEVYILQFYEIYLGLLLLLSTVFHHTTVT